MRIVELIFTIVTFFTLGIGIQLPVSTGQSKGELTGIVIDINGTRVPHAKVVIIGNNRYEIFTSEDGTYKAVLPSDMYQIRVENTELGFSPTRRAAFYLEPSITTTLNFTLFSPYSVLLPYETSGEGTHTVLDDGPLVEFKYEGFLLPRLAVAPRELLIRYGERKEQNNIVTYTANVITSASTNLNKPYPGVMVSYNLISLQANKVVLDKGTFSGLAEGNVIIEENGKQHEVTNCIKFNFKQSKPIVQ